jgi:hypothetical protein
LDYSPVVDTNDGYATNATGATANQRLKKPSAVLADGIEMKFHRDASATQNLDNFVHLCLHTGAKIFVLQEIDDGLQKSLRGLDGS